MVAKAKKKITFGTVGCGAIVEKSFIPAVQQNTRAKLLAATRNDRAKLADFCRSYGIERPCSSLEEMLGDPQLDVIYVATPVACHFAHVLAAAEHGKHVLCEKPLGTNLAEAREAFEVCQRKGVRLWVAYYRRAFPEVTRIQKLLSAEVVGQLLLIRFHHGTWYMPEPSAAASWRFDPLKSGGGALMDIGSHRLDLVNFLFGKPRRAFCRLAFQVESWQVESGATTIMELKNGGAAQVSVYFNQQEKTDSLEIYGSKGNLCCPKLGSGEIIIATEAQRQTIQVGATTKSQTHIPVIESVVNELLEGTDNPLAAARILPTEEIIDACYRSANEGRWIDLEESKVTQ